MNTTLLIATGMLTTILLGGCVYHGPLQAPETGYQSAPTEPTPLAAAPELQASGALRNLTDGAAPQQMRKAAGQAGQRLTEAEQ